MNPACPFSGESCDLKESKVQTASLFWFLRFRLKNQFCYTIFAVSSFSEYARNIRRGNMVKIKDKNVLKVGRVVAISDNYKQLDRNAQALIHEDMINYEYNLKLAIRCRQNNVGNTAPIIDQMRNIVHYWFKQFAEKVLSCRDIILYRFDSYKIVLRIFSYQFKIKFLIMLVLNNKILTKHCVVINKKKRNSANLKKMLMKDTKLIIDFMNASFIRCKVTLLNSLRTTHKTNCTTQFRLWNKRS